MESLFLGIYITLKLDVIPHFRHSSSDPRSIVSIKLTEVRLGKFYFALTVKCLHIKQSEKLSQWSKARN